MDGKRNWEGEGVSTVDEYVSGMCEGIYMRGRYKKGKPEVARNLFVGRPQTEFSPGYEP